MLPKRRRSRWILPLLIGTLLLVLSACGGQSQPETGGGEESAPSTGAEESASEEQVTLRLWMQQDNRLVNAMQDLVASFEEAHPNIDVQLDSFPFSEYHQKISTAFAGGDAPDVFWMDVRVASFAEQGALLPLNDRIDQSMRDSFIGSAWIETQFEGQTYGVPMHQLTEALYVNTELAEAAGVRLPQTVDEAWTWEEFLAAAQAMTQRSGDQTDVWGFGVQRHLQDWSVLPVVYQRGASVLSDDLTSASGHLNSPETVEALSWYGALFNEHRVASPEPIPDGFQTGKVAIFQAPSTFRPVLDNDFPDLDYTIVPLFKEAQCSVMTGGWNVSIAATTEHPDEAWMLLEWITREKHAEWVDKSGYLPAQPAVIDSDAKFSEYPWTLFLEQLQNCAATRPPVPQYTFFFDTFKQAITDIAIGEDPQATLDAAAAKLDAELGQ